MDFFSQKDFSKIVKNNAQSLRHDNLPKGTNVMRIYDRNLQDFPVTVDLYGAWAKVVDFGDQQMSEQDVATTIDLINRFAYVDADKIVYSYRNKRDGREQHQKTEEQACIVEVKENNLKFKVDLSSYTDTGLFLDNVNARNFIKENCLGKDVLNLFSYTGSFSVYAAHGLAKSVTSVDLSNTYTQWAVENLSNNGFEGDLFKCVCADASKFVEQQMNNNVHYDIIIFDPPSFSNSHKMEHDFDVQRDFVLWVKKLASLLNKGGFILFSTNLGSFRMDRRRLKGLSVKETTDQFRADGFVKGRKGTVRSWIMTVEDSFLTLDWSEDKKPEEKKEQSASRERRDYKSDRPRRQYNDEDRPRRRFDDDRPRRRFDDDRPRRRFSDEEERPRRFHNDEDRPRRRFDDDRPRRRFRDDEERPRRFRNDEDRPRRRFDDDRPRRRFSDEEERPRRFHNDEDRPRRRFDDDRPRRSFSDKSEYKRPEKASSKHDKPYGFDTFKPARNRNDSSDFFWNPDDIKPKK